MKLECVLIDWLFSATVTCVTVSVTPRIFIVWNAKVVPSEYNSCVHVIFKLFWMKKKEHRVLFIRSSDKKLKIATETWNRKRTNRVPLHISPSIQVRYIDTITINCLFWHKCHKISFPEIPCCLWCNLHTPLLNLFLIFMKNNNFGKKNIERNSTFKIIYIIYAKLILCIWFHLHSKYAMIYKTFSVCWNFFPKTCDLKAKLKLCNL